jgi:hypothetical protein
MPDGTEENDKNPGQDSLSPGRNLNPGPPGNEARIITTGPRHSVIVEIIRHQMQLLCRGYYVLIE